MFAAVLMILVGVFQTISGLTAIIDDEFFVVTRRTTRSTSTRPPGVDHLLLGIVVFLAGLSLFAQKGWAGMVALALAILSAIANFLFIPYYPFWSIVMIALAVW